MRSIRPIIAAILLSAGSVAAGHGRQSTDEGLRLLRKMQDSLGGAKAIAAIRDLDEVIDAQAWDSAGTALGEVRKRTRWMQNPTALRLDQRGPRGTYVLYLDGRSLTGWELLPNLTSADPYKTTGTAVALAGGELDFARGYLSGFEINLWLADQRGYLVTSPRPNVIRITHDGSPTDLTLDPATGRPVSSAGVSLSDPDRPVPAEMRFEGWTEVSGVRFPSRRSNYLSGLKRGEVNTASIRVNIGLRQADLAAKPADGAPDLPPRSGRSASGR